jgi:putative iron-dependent peroxidase
MPLDGLLRARDLVDHDRPDARREHGLGRHGRRRAFVRLVHFRTFGNPGVDGFVELILPQPGIFAQGTAAHFFLEFDLKREVTLERALDSFRRLRSPEVSAGGVNLVIGFSSRVWRTVAKGQSPKSLAEFREFVGTDGHRAPATQHDVWLWISGGGPDVVWDHAMAAVELVRDVANVASEQAGFSYNGGRDMTGFIDGTANPPLLRAATVALVPGGEPGEGGSHVLAMRWVHDLLAFHQLRVEDQERVIGRRKSDSVELSEAEKPPTAHISRVQVEVDGTELEIFRRSVPYGNVKEHGLYFVAFSADPSRFDRMLAKMFGVSGDGVRDRLTDYSRPVSGAYYFVPSQNSLRELAGPEES